MRDCQPFVYLYLEFLLLDRILTMNHTVFSGIIQMRTYDLVLVVAKKFIIKSRGRISVIHGGAKMRNLSSSVVFFLCLIYYYLSYFFFHDKNRNFVSLSCNQTIYYIKTNAISYSMCSYINVDSVLTCEEKEEHVIVIMF